MLLNFYRFWGSPSGGVADGRMGWWWVWVCRGVSHAHMHAHAHACMHAHMHMHVKHDKHDKHGCLHVGSHLQFLYMRLRACACMHMHVCVCGDTPHPQVPLRHPPPTCPLPRAAGSQKHQNSISLELIEIFRFCLKILYL